MLTTHVDEPSNLWWPLVKCTYSQYAV